MNKAIFDQKLMVALAVAIVAIGLGAVLLLNKPSIKNLNKVTNQNNTNTTQINNTNNTEQVAEELLKALDELVNEK